MYLEFGVFGYSIYGTIYDHRHRDDENDCWEPQLDK